MPETATAPVLVLVGVMMMNESTKIPWSKMDDGLPAFLTLILMPLTYSISNGMIIGLAAAVGFYFTTGQFLVDLRHQFRRARRAILGTSDTDGSNYDEQLPVLSKTEQSTYGSSL